MGWVILACILAALLLVSLIRVGADADYDGAQLTVRLRVGPVHLRVYPMKKKREKPPADPETAPKKPSPGPEKGALFSLLRALLPVALRAAGSLRRRISVDRLEARILLAGSDPAAVATAFGSVNAMLGMVLPLLEQNFRIRQRDIRTAVDFQRTHSELSAGVALSLTVGQGVSFALRFGFQALGVLLRWRRQQNETKKQVTDTTERAVAYGKEPSHQ
ncbi:DUF2953 domain-containing protein [Intestinimonas sp.]|uniref:DUF2953 domain-containing protein n=1 Tax=Intestinimonas sp. TaxID=1965293 RepID=UPI002609A2D9|nr:DUF2953 domain-containing protein [Intestinimonas sp.]